MARNQYTFSACRALTAIGAKKLANERCHCLNGNGDFFHPFRIPDHHDIAARSQYRRIPNQTVYANNSAGLAHHVGGTDFHFFTTFIVPASFIILCQLGVCVHDSVYVAPLEFVR